MHEMSTAVHSSQWTKGRSLNMASHVFVHVQSKTPYSSLPRFAHTRCVYVGVECELKKEKKETQI